MTPLERVQRLIQRLSASREQTIKLLHEGVGTGNTMAYLRSRLTEIEKELAKANKLLQEELQRIACDSYTRAALEGLRTVGMQASEIERLRKDGIDAVKAAIEDRAKLFDPTIPTIGRIEYDKRIQARAAMESVGRQIDDIVRRETMEVVVRQTSDKPIAPKEAAKDLTQRLAGYGGTGVRYRNNRIMPYDKYAAMVARTTEREANNTGFIQVAVVAGTGLVKMTTHSPTCPICAPRQGRIYRVMDFPEGDERNGFPYIDMALPGWPQYVTVHPNCRHALRPVGIWRELTEGQKKALLEEAKKSFDVDPRSEAEIRAYNAQQEKNRKRNDDLNQYRRYRSILGGDMPTFSGWRRMKAADSERYQMIRLDFQRRNRLLQDSSLALPGAEGATAAEAKFTKYLFDPNSEDGWPKGVAIARRLGYNISNWEGLRGEVLTRAMINPAKHSGSNAYGEKYEQQIVLYGLNGKPTNVLIGWIVDEHGVRLTTMHLKEVKN